MVKAQSIGDLHAHGHGWGVADYADGLLLVEKQVWAAFHGEHFTKAARSPISIRSGPICVSTWNRFTGPTLAGRQTANMFSAIR
ncbi:hypothetical protein [Roseobacter sp.]|uniref:hypothetical protein n=1 Tax=Roseobacter sp. TaxID=1907202 RepID=UPI00385D0B65